MMNHFIVQNVKTLNFDTERFEKKDIEIKDGVIKKVEEKINQSLPTIDCSNQYVIPGLIDMHVHIKSGFAHDFLAAGVTTVRNTGGNVLELKSLIEAEPTAPIPRVFSADRIIDGPPGLWGDTSPWNYVTSDETEAILEVRRQAETGANLIKVYGLLEKDLMRAVVEETSKYNLPVSCDLVQSKEINCVEAARLGVKWNEHAAGVIQALGYNSLTSWDGLFVEEKLYPIAQELIDHKVILCPTMTLFDQMNKYPSVWNPLKENINESLINQWKMISQHKESLNLSAKLTSINQAFSRIYKQLGGTVVAGTDSPAGIYTWPGYALHRELELFVQNGWSKIEAIKSATVDAATSMGIHDSGLIEPSYKADLIFLKGNPLKCIQQTQSINQVMKGGRLYSQEEILKNKPSESETVQSMKEFLDVFHSQVNESWYEELIKIL
ncbi:amidohydrolase family protein [Halalkalibacillus halophilus]|uniref:amidohydrolase family protein n=1 Tax=Halalkalibacillus halophilus TaxID=392827 RepID=UPI000425AC05|nr:amidohydrolase family protein [Halalkalibacillus halophilus]